MEEMAGSTLALKVQRDRRRIIEMDKVRVAIVGCGTISRLNVPGYIEDERCDVAVLCDPVRERAEFKAKA